MQNISHKSKEEIYKCSKCGLCQSVCPLFLATKNEMFSPRGRFIILNNHINNGVKLSNDFIKNLDFCLNCNLCKDFCPSNIDTKEILTEFKSKYSKKSFNLRIRIFYLFVSILKNIYRFFPFKSFFIGSFFDSLFEVKIARNKKKKFSASSTPKVVFFEGCYNKYINCSDRNASLNILEEMGFDVKTISNCCGYPLLCDANISRFKSNIQKIISQIPNDCEYIICSCDTCYDTLKSAKQYVGNIEFDSKLITFDEFLKLNNYFFETACNSLYFNPLIRKQNNTYFSETQTISKKGLCSLMENFFFIKHQKFSNNLAKQLDFTNIENSEKHIITTSNITKLGLQKIFNIQNKKNKIYSLSEYLINKKA